MKSSRHIPAFTALLVFALFYCSCNSTQSRRLSDIESYIDSRPDSALAAIRQIDTAALRGRAVKAKYSLLHAIALDKNYIDTADTRIVQPAVEWYDRHGSPEERLKAYYYLGRELYNGCDYYNAFVAFSTALEGSSEACDAKIVGMAYTGLADSSIKTQDYDISKEYLNKALLCFEKSGNHDFTNLVKIRLAQVCFNQGKIDEAEHYYKDLLSDKLKSPTINPFVEGEYAVFLCNFKPGKEDEALQLFNDVISSSGKLSDANQYGAYSYALLSKGYVEESDSIIKLTKNLDFDNGRYYKYWSHRLLISTGRFREAYNMLYEAKQVSDSISASAMAFSSSLAQQAYLENKNLSREIKEQHLCFIFSLSVLLLLLISTIVYLLYLRERKIRADERNQLMMIKETLEKQVHSLEGKLQQEGNELAELRVKNNKARLSYISELYEIVHAAGNDDNPLALNRLYRIIQKKIRFLNDDSESRLTFENTLNRVSNGIMDEFRKDYPNMTEQDYRLASLVFAGFDNAMLSLLMGLSPSHTRTRKTRLLNKIRKGAGRQKDYYERYFGNK